MDKTSFITIVITALVTFFLTQAGNILIHRQKRQEKEEDKRMGLAKSIRNQYTRLLPRLEEFHRLLIVHHIAKTKQKPSISSLGWDGVKGNLLLHKANDSNFFELMKQITLFDLDINPPSDGRIGKEISDDRYLELDKLLVEATRVCEKNIAMPEEEIIKKYGLK